jgi:Resolvase, N terminal domain
MGGECEQALDVRVGPRTASRHSGLSQMECRLFATVRPQQEQEVAGRPAGTVQLGQRAALYCRVSTADQSCARQERDLTAFAERAGYAVVATFKETASGTKLDRAERRKAMALAQTREHRRDSRDRAIALGTQHDRPAGDVEGIAGTARVSDRAERHDVRSLDTAWPIGCAAMSPCRWPAA